jgi:DNA helicase-2/ATP-dependent DNA helicase PcrA
VAQKIRGLRGEGQDYRDVAVFYRTNAQSRVLEDALRRAGIPYLIVGGVRALRAARDPRHGGLPRLVSNPLDDVAFRRAVTAPPAASAGHAGSPADAARARASAP